MTAVIPVLNKTYVDTFSTEVAINTTTKTVFESKEFTVQGNKAFNLIVQAPYTPAQTNLAHWAGVTFASSMKVNSVWYDLGTSGYALSMALARVRPERHYDCKYIDLVGDSIVPADRDYTIVVRLRAKMYGYTGAVNSAHNHINHESDSGNRGIGILEAIEQNWTTIMIQEKDRT